MNLDKIEAGDKVHLEFEVLSNPANGFLELLMRGRKGSEYFSTNRVVRVIKKAWEPNNV